MLAIQLIISASIHVHVAIAAACSGLPHNVLIVAEEEHKNEYNTYGLESISGECLQFHAVVWLVILCSYIYRSTQQFEK